MISESCSCGSFTENAQELFFDGLISVDLPEKLWTIL